VGQLVGKKHSFRNNIGDSIGLIGHPFRQLAAAFRFDNSVPASPWLRTPFLRGAHAGKFTRHRAAVCFLS
jgi:hypothetical protein